MLKWLWNRILDGWRMQDAWTKWSYIRIWTFDSKVTLLQNSQLAGSSQPQHYLVAEWHFGFYYFGPHFLTSGQNFLKFDMKIVQAFTIIKRSKSKMQRLYTNFQQKLWVSTKMKPLNLGAITPICQCISVIVNLFINY